MDPRVQAVEAMSEYRLRITFSNGEVGVYDCRPLLDLGVFCELRDEGCFRRVRAKRGTVV